MALSVARLHHDGISRIAYLEVRRLPRMMGGVEFYPLGLLLGLVATWVLLALSDRVRATPR